MNTVFDALGNNLQEEVITPIGKLYAVHRVDDDYPGIGVFFQKTRDEEPIELGRFEFSPITQSLVSLTYDNAMDMNSEPQIIPISLREIEE